MASKIRAHALEGMVTQRGLEISFLDPGGGLDDKVVEVCPAYHFLFRLNSPESLSYNIDALFR